MTRACQVAAAPGLKVGEKAIRGGSSGARDPPAMQEMQLQVPGSSRPPGEGNGSVLAWEIPWTEGPGSLQTMGSQRIRYDLATEQQQHPLKTNRDSREATF